MNDHDGEVWYSELSAAKRQLTAYYSPKIFFSELVEVVSYCDDKEFRVFSVFKIPQLFQLYYLMFLVNTDMQVEKILEII